jgi:hypothetical protein
MDLTVQIKEATRMSAGNKEPHLCPAKIADGK